MDQRSGIVASFGGRHRRRPAASLCVGAIVLFALVVSIASLALAASTNFPDVPASHPYYPAITDLASRGIIGGYSDGSFGPNNPVTRQQFAKMIVLAGSYSVSEGDVCAFADVAKGDATTLYPDNYVAVCAANGITIGKTSTAFDPQGLITRHQVISMVVRMADNRQPGLLVAPPTGWAGNAAWGGNATHGANAAVAEYNGLLDGLDLVALDPSGNMNRGEVAQVLHNLLGKLPSGWPTTSSTTTSSTTTTLPAVGSTPSNLVPKGQTAEVGVFKVKVTGAILNATQTVHAELSAPLGPGAGSQYVLVTLSVTNTGSTASHFGFPDVDKTYVGSKGDRFRVDSFILSMTGLPVVEEVSPGATASGNLLFEVPSSQVSGGCLQLLARVTRLEYLGGTRFRTYFEWISTYFALK